LSAGEHRTTARSEAEQGDLRQQVAGGLAFAHTRLNATVARALESTSFLYALIELLSEHGLVSIEELDTRREVVGERLGNRLRAGGEGVVVQDPEIDKYEFGEGEVEIDCLSRLHLCKAACCRLPWALSKQDVYEGIVRWDFSQPYLNERGPDGYCTHLERGTCLCSIREHRPVPCRAFDCRSDPRIWVDFEEGVPNPRLEDPDWPMCEAADRPCGGGVSSDDR
jgi:hypothetical protein